MSAHVLGRVHPPHTRPARPAPLPPPFSPQQTQTHARTKDTFMNSLPRSTPITPAWATGAKRQAMRKEEQTTHRLALLLPFVLAAAAAMVDLLLLLPV
jgi:hypothetical protein